MSARVELEATVDRIEEGSAVIAIRGGGELLVPSERLPDGVKEGTALRVSLEADPERTESLRDLTESLQRRLREQTSDPSAGDSDSEPDR